MKQQRGNVYVLDDQTIQKNFLPVWGGKVDSPNLPKSHHRSCLNTGSVCECVFSCLTFLSPILLLDPHRHSSDESRVFGAAAKGDRGKVDRGDRGSVHVWTVPAAVLPCLAPFYWICPPVLLLIYRRGGRRAGRVAGGKRGLWNGAYVVWRVDVNTLPGYVTKNMQTLKHCHKDKGSPTSGSVFPNIFWAMASYVSSRKISHHTTRQNSHQNFM